MSNPTNSFLQVYHHTGIAIAMWAACATGSNWVVWPVVLNSFIHTLMYTYFAAATLGYRSPLAKMLTTMQLTQFVMGITLSSSTYVYGKATQEQGEGVRVRSWRDPPVSSEAKQDPPVSSEARPPCVKRIETPLCRA